MADSSADSQIFSKHGSWTLALLVAAPVLYVLTAPWILLLAYKCKLPLDTLEYVYQPLTYIAMSGTWYGDLFVEYVSWCSEITGVI